MNNNTVKYLDTDHSQNDLSYCKSSNQKHINNNNIILNLSQKIMIFMFISKEAKLQILVSLMLDDKSLP